MINHLETRPTLMPCNALFVERDSTHAQSGSVTISINLNSLSLHNLTIMQAINSGTLTVCKFTTEPILYIVCIESDCINAALNQMSKLMNIPGLMEAIRTLARAKVHVRTL